MLGVTFGHAQQARPTIHMIWTVAFLLNLTQMLGKESQAAQFGQFGILCAIA